MPIGTGMQRTAFILEQLQSVVERSVLFPTISDEIDAAELWIGGFPMIPRASLISWAFTGRMMPVLGDDPGDQLGRRDVEGGVVDVDALGSGLRGRSRG